MILNVVLKTMSKKSKLLQKPRQNPKNVRFEEIDKALRWYGFECRQAKRGMSHYVYTLTIRQKSYQISIPFKRPFVKRFYIQEAIKIFDELDEELGDSE